MSIKRINEFPDGSGSLSNDDVFLFMDDPSGSGVTKKISLSQIETIVGGGPYTTGSTLGSIKPELGGSTSSGYYSTVGGGKANTSSGYYSTVSGGRNNSSTGINSTVGGGSTNSASDSDATIGGGFTNSASQIGATIGGGRYNTSSNVHSTIGGGRNNSSTGDGSTIGGGAENTSSGYNSTIGGGKYNTSSGYFSVVAGGYGNTSSGYASTVVGGIFNSATGNFSSVLSGRFSIADKHGMRAYNVLMDNIPGNGASQHVSFLASKVTTNALSTVLLLDGSVAVLTIRNNTALFATVSVAGIINGGGKAVHYMRKVAIKNVANTVSLIGSVSTIGTDVEDDISYDLNITANNTNKTLQISVNGKVGETIRWLAHIDGIELGIG